jgi:hypothetical protein
MKCSKRSFTVVSVLFALSLSFGTEAQCAGCRSRLSHPRDGSDSQSSMHKYLSCAISRLPVLEANTIARVWGLHPLHLWCWSTVLGRVSEVIDREGRASGPC